MKKQFDERQEQMKETMAGMKTRFDETLRDKEDIFNKRVEKAENAKERGQYNNGILKVSVVTWRWVRETRTGLPQRLEIIESDSGHLKNI